MTETTAYATCPLCEATCGLELSGNAILNGIPIEGAPAEPA